MKIVTAALVLTGVLSIFSFDTQAQERGQEKFIAALEACRTELGLTKPENGHRPSEEDRAKMHECMEAKGFKHPTRHGRGQMNKEFRNAMKACAEENNLKRPERGTHPSDEDRAKMEACLERKGFSKPEGGPRGVGSASAQ